MFVICAGVIYDAQADTIYRWEDDHGVMHYSSQPPPPGVAGAEVDSLSPLPMVGTVPARIGQLSAQVGSDSATSEVARAKREEIARRNIQESSYHEALAIECEQARNVMRKLLDAEYPMISRYDGSVQAMDQDERSRRIHEAAKFVHVNCR